MRHTFTRGLLLFALVASTFRGGQAFGQSWANVRTIDTRADVSQATEDRIPLQWKQAETVIWNHRSTRGSTQPFPLTASNSYVLMEVVSTTNEAVTYIVLTSTVQNASNGWTKTTISPSNSNLAVGSYYGYLRLIQTNATTNVVNMGVLAQMNVTVQFSPNSTNYNIISPSVTTNVLLPGTIFGGDVSGVYSNLQIGDGAITNTDLATNMQEVIAGAITNVTSSGQTQLIYVTRSGRIINIGLSNVLHTGTAFGGSQIAGTGTNLGLRADSVSRSNLNDGAVGTDELLDDAVNSDKLAGNAVLSSHISDGEIENADIGAAAAIAMSKIAGLAALSNNFVTATGTLATVVASDALKLAASHTNTADWATNYLPRTGGAMTGETVFSNAVKIVSRMSGTHGNIEQSGAFGGSLQVVVAVVGSNSATGPRNVGFIQNGQIGSGFSDQTGTNTLSIGSAFGAMQSGIVRARYGETKMVIATGGDGAMQRGYLDAESNAYAYATNSGRGSIGIFNITASGGTVSGQLITGHASIGLGAVRVTNDSAIVVGDGNVSHGNKSITADSFWGTTFNGSFVGNGAGITNVDALTFGSAPVGDFANQITFRGGTLTASGGNIDLIVSETSTFANVISRGGSLAASALTNIPAQSITGTVPAAVITASSIATGTPKYIAVTQVLAGALGGVLVSNVGSDAYVSSTNPTGFGWSGVVATQTVNMAGNAITNLNRIGLVGQTNLVPIRGDLFASNGVVYFVGSSGSASAQYGENNLTIGNYQTIASAQAAATNYARWLGNSPPTSNTANGSHMEVRMNQTNVFIYNVASGKWFRITGTMEWP